jgi:hypothetical protein
MNESNLYRAVANATGESVALIRRMGFSLVPDSRISTSHGLGQPHREQRHARTRRLRQRNSRPQVSRTTG